MVPLSVVPAFIFALCKDPDDKFIAGMLTDAEVVINPTILKLLSTFAGTNGPFVYSVPPFVTSNPPPVAVRFDIG
jgi:hypothetical protein